jgi:hypothetical protein
VALVGRKLPVTKQKRNNMPQHYFEKPRFGDLINEANTIIINHPPQERCQLGKIIVWQAKGNINVQPIIEFYRDAGSTQG